MFTSTVITFSLLTNNFTLQKRLYQKPYNDIALNMDTGKVTELTLLDLSAAFDTIDYSGLLDRLSDWYSISGTFLINRFQ